MSQINAFVGHSFVEEDQELVQRILDCLSRVSEIHSGFAWEHATHPEPRGVDEKVLNLFAGKNLFIAICTRKERVVGSSELSPVPLLKSRALVTLEKLVWKTSDWIIQEIGVAIGKGMRIILLVEEGVRRPGALQGNLEYIEFSRDSLDSCFTRLLGMIAALTPRQILAAASAERTGATENEATPEASESVDFSWETPDATWHLSQYKIAFMIMVKDSRDEEAAKISIAFKASQLANDQKSRDQWEAWVQLCRIRAGKLDALRDLRKLVDATPNDATVREYLSRAYIFFGEHAAAATELAIAAANAIDVPKRVQLLSWQVDQLNLANDKAAAAVVMEEMRSTVFASGLGEPELLRAEIDLAKNSGRNDICLGCLERIVELDPSEVNHRFELAFKYSEMDQSGLAAMHYSRIPEAGRSGVAWNNLGVALAALEMPFYAIESYRQAERLGETLATSNLALARLEAGFQVEAVGALEAALKIENHHKNILTSLTRAKAVPDEEKANELKIFEKAARVSEFNRNYGRALVLPRDLNMNGSWVGPRCKLSIKIKDDSFVAIGSYETKGNGLLALALMGNQATGLSDVQASTTVFEVEYLGNIRGRAVHCTLSVSRQGESRRVSSLLSAEKSQKVNMWLSADGKTLSVMENSESREPAFYEIGRVLGALPD